MSSSVKTDAKTESESVDLLKKMERDIEEMKKRFDQILKKMDEDLKKLREQSSSSGR